MTFAAPKQFAEARRSPPAAKAGGQGNPVIAAVNRRATQRKNQPSFLALHFSALQSRCCFTRLARLKARTATSRRD